MTGCNRMAAAEGSSAKINSIGERGYPCLVTRKESEAKPMYLALQRVGHKLLRFRIKLLG